MVLCGVGKALTVLRDITRRLKEELQHDRQPSSLPAAMTACTPTPSAA
jgi:hypothetical protein